MGAKLISQLLVLTNYLIIKDTIAKIILNNCPMSYH